MDNLNLFNVMMVGGGDDDTSLASQDLVRFSAPTAFKIKVADKANSNSTAFDFSYKRQRDVEWVSQAVTQASATTSNWIDVDANEIIYFKASTTAWSNATRKVGFLLSGTGHDVGVSGNAQTLINNQAMGTDYCFDSLFSGCTNLKYANAFTLPWYNATPYCYQKMFKGCQYLTTVPSLTPSSLAIYCYAEMFMDCSNLVSPPSINSYASTAKAYCFDGMFAGCSKLTTYLSIPSQGLADYCYAGMYASCTKLSTAPALPATTLADGCYSQMFEYCTALTSAPTLAATALKDDCY